MHALFAFHNASSATVHLVFFGHSLCIVATVDLSTACAHPLYHIFILVQLLTVIVIQTHTLTHTYKQTDRDTNRHNDMCNDTHTQAVMYIHPYTRVYTHVCIMTHTEVTSVFLPTPVCYCVVNTVAYNYQTLLTISSQPRCHYQSRKPKVMILTMVAAH